MADTKKTVQRSKTDDFRRVETHIEEAVEGAATQRVTTVKEEVVPMTVKQVVRETIVPVVTSRKIESYEDGRVVATEHEVVPDEALALSEYESKVTQAEITQAIESAITRGLAAFQQKVVSHPSYEERGVVHAPVTPSPVPQLTPVSNFLGGFDGTLILYALVAMEAAAIVYFTVLKGWLLN